MTMTFAFLNIVKMPAIPKQHCSDSQHVPGDCTSKFEVRKFRVQLSGSLQAFPNFGAAEGAAAAAGV